MQGKWVILGVTASIAAYKACDLASRLVKAGAHVQVIMTKNATNLVQPATFEALTQNKCLVDTFDRGFEYSVEHISLAKKADAFVVAPATANFIAKAAHGMADDMLTTTFLACDCPKFIAPAMNTRMYENPATKENMSVCTQRGMHIIEPQVGHLACGDEGKGKLADPLLIFEHIAHAISFRKDFAGKTVLVTAGPTQEAIDPVRYITNHSSGKMGYAVAAAASARGADVTLVSGKVSLSPPLFVKTIPVVSARQMAQEVKALFSSFDIIIKAAAVADYTPASVSEQKVKKSNDTLALPLVRTEDILAYIGAHKSKNQFICGFSMETEDMVSRSREKLRNKNLDLIVANNVKTPGAGFAVDTNVVTLISAGGETELPCMSKDAVAHALLDAIMEQLPR